MADARFSGLYMVIPCMGVIMLFVFIMQFLIRLWMINSPKYVRKSVRFPLNEDLTDFIMSSAYPKDTPRAPVSYVQQGYKPRTPPPVYYQQGQQEKHSMARPDHRTEPPGYYPRQQAAQAYPREPSYDTGFPRSIGI